MENNKNMFPIKDVRKRKAELLANNYLNSEEGKIEIERINKEALYYMVYGNRTFNLNEDLLDEMKDYFVKDEELTVDEIIARFEGLLSEKEISNIKKLKDGES